MEFPAFIWHGLKCLRDVSIGVGVLSFNCTMYTGTRVVVCIHPVFFLTLFCLYSKRRKLFRIETTLQQVIPEVVMCFCSCAHMAMLCFQMVLLESKILRIYNYTCFYTYIYIYIYVVPPKLQDFSPEIRCWF